VGEFDFSVLKLVKVFPILREGGREGAEN